MFGNTLLACMQEDYEQEGKIVRAGWQLEIPRSIRTVQRHAQKI